MAVGNMDKDVYNYVVLTDTDVGNGDKPRNCFARQWWKAHDYLQGLGDFSVAALHSVVHNVLESAAAFQWWTAMFEFFKL